MTEEYIELYKKYRPTQWNELIGQEKTARSLQSAVVNNKLPTAFIFIGPRGTGKTSSAFLLAKAINCLNVSKTGNPCNECDVCVNIDNGSQIGVNYESMANRGSVDDVRSIVQKAQLNQPVKKQVWILDEIHNLSKAGFDALLIPLENKNMPSLFIFCSTESDKIPATITSRVQQRRLNLVSSEDMMPFLEGIKAKESLDCSEQDLKESIRQGRGSVRDTLSALESLISTGESSSSFGGLMLESIASHSLPDALKVVSDAINEGYDGRDLAEQLFSDLRDLLLLVSGVDKTVVDMIDVSDVKTVAKGLIGKTGIAVVAEEIADSITHMTLGSDSRIHFEIALVKSIAKLNKLQKAVDAKG